MKRFVKDTLDLILHEEIQFKNVVTSTEAYKYNVIIKADEEIYIRFNTKR